MRLASVLLAFAVLAGCGGNGTTSSEPAPSASAADEISRAEAIEQARDAVRELGADWDVLYADLGALEEARPNWRDYEWSRDLPGDLRVWSVGLDAGGGLSAQVIIDPVDGSVYGYVAGVAN